MELDNGEENLGDDILSLSTADIQARARLMDNEVVLMTHLSFKNLFSLLLFTLPFKVRIMRSELGRIQHELQAQQETIKENEKKIKQNKTLPYLVSNIIEVLEVNPEDEEEIEGANVDLDSQRKGKSVVIKTTTRQTYFLPVAGLVEPEKLKPGDLVGVNKDSYLILDTLPSEYDSRVKAMEVDTRPTEQYSDIGGLDKQIQELVEAVVLPMTHKDRFVNLGIKPPKGVLM